jgi:hypothetical protein
MTPEPRTTMLRGSDEVMLRMDWPRVEGELKQAEVDERRVEESQPTS